MKLRQHFILALLLMMTQGAWATVAINGKLPGSFSVSGEKKVCFSQGNLQYQGSTGTWRFATHQYDFIGNAAGNICKLAWAMAYVENGRTLSYGLFTQAFSMM